MALIVIASITLWYHNTISHLRKRLSEHPPTQFIGVHIPPGTLTTNRFSTAYIRFQGTNVVDATFSVQEK